MKTILTAIPAVLLASTAMASNFGPAPIPEISALEGGAAIAALAAGVLFLWERRRKA
ncbi:hypothetical protein TRM7557_01920 [Tritonibacter multivorans]|uniref:Uncharacterized protein n=1 Tax=Tritonibacter multivorans TaxID=928856 RepID=A0A0P1GAK0_9RHOB|nr:hypothetical protein [Tritonibacter multivorans]MDA7422076.1 hypothetical protein [Tritonibacter multivorans]CUH78515.1 hypothetical protein TRM7557_01920 [Tritonibacter multivorans]SFD17918.1 hypothetical protein SAMN04488049_10891 [Tritonibacter multivorans]